MYDARDGDLHVGIVVLHRAPICRGKWIERLLLARRTSARESIPGARTMIYLPDRVRHGAILGLTGCLPRRLRIRARMSALGQSYEAKARRADIIIIVHPKSGGTWLRVMLSRIYQTKYGLRPHLLVKSDELCNYVAALPRFLITNGHYAYEGAVKRLFEEVDTGRAFHGKKVILLIRHPCDIAVSWYLQFKNRTKAYKRELIEATLRHPVRRDEISIRDFVLHSELGLTAIIEYLNEWEKLVSRVPLRLVVRYEDLRSRPADTLRRVVSFIGEDVADGTIEEAVAFGSFDNLRSMEMANFFKSGGLSLRDPKNPDTYKVRRGKVGGYRDYFNHEDVALMDAIVQARLSPAFGYGTATSPVEHAIVDA